MISEQELPKEVVKESYIDTKMQIKLLNELYKMDYQTSIKDKTIVVYDLYKDEAKYVRSLNNLQTFAKLLVDPKL